MKRFFALSDGADMVTYYICFVFSYEMVKQEQPQKEHTTSTGTVVTLTDRGGIEALHARKGPLSELNENI